jgi:hypothetical protein
MYYLSNNLFFPPQLLTPIRMDFAAGGDLTAVTTSNIKVVYSHGLKIDDPLLWCHPIPVWFCF